MKEVNEKVFLFIECLKQIGLIEFEFEFCDAIRLKKQNLNNIKNGSANFTIQHIYNISKEFKGNPNYFFGIDENMFKKKVNNIVNK